MPLPYLFLTLGIVLLWLPGRQYSPVRQFAWIGAFVIAVCLALYDGRLEFIALVSIFLFAGVCYYANKVTGRWSWLLACAVLLVSLAFGLHIIPGFYNLAIVENIKLAPDSIPYSLWLNFDKALVGLFILGFLHPLVSTRYDVLKMLKQLLPIALITMGLVVLFSFLLGYIRYDFKIPAFLAWWLWANLFFTCVAEEALFRGFMQRQLALHLSNIKHGAVLALVLCAILFGLAHIAGGVKYAMLATIAGLGYGWAYYRTSRIEASILLHFAMNTLHILLFSYPALVS